MLQIMGEKFSSWARRRTEEPWTPAETRLPFSGPDRTPRTHAPTVRCFGRSKKGAYWYLSSSPGSQPSHTISRAGTDSSPRSRMRS